MVSEWHFQKLQELNLAPEMLTKILIVLSQPRPASIRQARWRAKKASTITSTVDASTVTSTVKEERVSPAPLPKEETLPLVYSLEESEQTFPIQKFPTNEDLEEAAEGWNLIAEMRGLPKIRGLDEERRKLLRARLNELKSVEAFGEVLLKVRDSPFCCGERGFRASFDWVLRKSSVKKLLEGNYDEQEAKRPAYVGNGQHYN